MPAAAAVGAEDAGGISDARTRTVHVSGGRPRPLAEAISIAAPRGEHLANEATAVMHYARSLKRAKPRGCSQRQRLSKRRQTANGIKRLSSSMRSTIGKLCLPVQLVPSNV